VEFALHVAVFDGGVLRNLVPGAGPLLETEHVISFQRKNRAAAFQQANPNRPVGDNERALNVFQDFIDQLAASPLSLTAQLSPICSSASAHC